jgi:VAD1 Analog of StAR-related lipid transfer domain
VGPSHAPTKKRQRLRRYPGCGICITNSTTVEGLPGADCFVVEDQWVIEVVREGATSSNKPSLKFSTKFGANFTKYTFLKGIIQKNINAGNIEWFEGYRRMVVTAVKLQQENVSDMKTLESDTASKSAQVGLENSRSMANLFGQLPIQGGTVLLIAGVVCQILLLLLLLVVVIEVRRSQQNSMAILEDLKLLRLEHGKLLEFLVTGTKECTKFEVQTD